MRESGKKEKGRKGEKGKRKGRKCFTCWPKWRGRTMRAVLITPPRPPIAVVSSAVVSVTVPVLVPTVVPVLVPVVLSVIVPSVVPSSAAAPAAAATTATAIPVPAALPVIVLSGRCSNVASCLANAWRRLRKPSRRLVPPRTRWRRRHRSPIAPCAVRGRRRSRNNTRCRRYPRRCRVWWRMERLVVVMALLIAVARRQLRRRRR